MVTKLTWIYEPPDFFETDYKVTGVDYTLEFVAGTAEARFSTAIDPVPETLRNQLEGEVRMILLARQLLIHRGFKIHSPRVIQEMPDGSRSTSALMSGNARIVLADQADMILTDASGNVVRDTKAERIAQHSAEVQLLTTAAAKEPLILKLLDSYNRAVADPSDELVHLYEILDCLSSYFGSEKAALKALAVSKGDRDLIGRLANDAPIIEGRHRGNKANLRPAREDELTKARAVAKKLVLSFANHVK